MTKVGILTVSDRCHSGAAEDKSGPQIRDLVESPPLCWTVAQAKCVPDEPEAIRTVLVSWSDSLGLDVVLTTGGTGFAPRDVTPEATKAVLDREAPGLLHLMTRASLEATPLAALSRAAAGIRGSTLIVNFPGSPKAVRECFAAILPVLAHAVDLLGDGDGPAGSKEAVLATHLSLQQGHSCCSSKVDTSNLASRPRRSPYPMVPVREAQDIVLANCKVALDLETVRSGEALHRVAGQDVFAREPLPPFAASIKDGYAVLASDGHVGTRKVVPSQESWAGVNPDQLARLEPGCCVRINTGAPLPPGADAVVQVEDTEVVKATPDGLQELEIEIRSGTPVVAVGQDVRPVGSDIAESELVIPKGTRLGAPEVGLLAAVGCTTVEVLRLPRVGVMSTGNELVDPERDQAAGKILGSMGKIRDSNRATLKALLGGEHGFPVLDLGIVRDDPGLLAAALRDAASKVDLIVTTGGVSMGDRDYVRQVVADDLGGDVKFARVQMKPGKPTTFATIPTSSAAASGATATSKVREVLFFGLPGNPVSATVTCHLFVLPALRKMSGLPKHFAPSMVARVPQRMRLDPRPEYARVVITSSPAGRGLDLGGAGGPRPLEVRTTGNQISSRLPSFVSANGLLVLPGATPQKGHVDEGDLVECLIIGPVFS